MAPLKKKGVAQVGALIGIVVGVIVLFLVAAQLIPEAQSAGDQLNASGVPLGNLFAGNGIIFTLLMIGIFVGLIAVFGFKTGKR